MRLELVRRGIQTTSLKGNNEDKDNIATPSSMEDERHEP